MILMFPRTDSPNGHVSDNRYLSRVLFLFLLFPSAFNGHLRKMNPDHPILAEIRHGFKLRPSKHKMVDKSGLRIEREELDPTLSQIKPELIPAPVAPPVQAPPPPPSNKNLKPVTKPALLKLGGPSTSVNRDELLRSIRDRPSLRKTATNDRSSPFLASDSEDGHSRSITPQPPYQQMAAPTSLMAPSVSPIPFTPAEVNQQQYYPMSEDDLPPPPPLPTYNAKRLSPLSVSQFESEATMRFSPEPPTTPSGVPQAPPLPPQMNLRVMAPVYAQPVVPHQKAEEERKSAEPAPPKEPAKKSDYAFNEDDLKTTQEQIRATIPTGSASQRIAMFGSRSTGSLTPKESNSRATTPKMTVRKEFVGVDKPFEKSVSPVPAPVVRPALPTSKPPPLPTTAAPEPSMNSSFNGTYKFQQRDENANVPKISAGTVIKQFEEPPKAASPTPKFAPSKAHGAHFAQIRDSFTGGAQTSTAPPSVSTGERVWKAAAMAKTGGMNGGSVSPTPNGSQMKPQQQPKANVSVPINAPWYVKKSDVGNISRNVAIPIRLAEENKLAKANGTNKVSSEPHQTQPKPSSGPQIIASNDRLHHIAQLHPELLQNGYKFDINLNSDDPIALVQR
ncbi:hypothetical protein L596_002297 [Steinernema carpocapsae]|uniref:WH2 domain-containing protein n=1 Tax=Steinernema carpocapsae TaxID=34508 RepID=A0A4U8UQQ8_STECR|nr:hypothetical protein L596_002297 [Steinernema carpocapsae]